MRYPRSVPLSLLALAAFVLLMACGGGESAADRIVFQSDRDGNPEIYVMNADGSGLTRLTDDPANDLSPAWSPAP